MAIKIDIPVEETKAIQQADLKCSTTRDLMLHFIKEDANNIDTPQWAKLKAQYMQEFEAFEAIKADLERKYIYPDYKDKDLVWSLNYSTSELILNEEEN